MSDFSIEKPVPYYEQFYHSIKKMIFDGTYKPGDRIVETQLAKQFNVSKSPVREAIRLLEKEGLLLVDEKSRVIVYEPTIKDVEDIYFCRIALESFAVKLMVQTAAAAEIEEVEKILLETKKAIEENREASTIIQLNGQFHQLIVQFTKNKRLQKQVNDLKSLTHFYRILNFQEHNRAAVILNEHYEIFTYIQKRESTAAAEAMIKHLKHDLKHLIEVLEKRA